MHSKTSGRTLSFPSLQQAASVSILMRTVSISQASRPARRARFELQPSVPVGLVSE